MAPERGVYLYAAVPAGAPIGALRGIGAAPVEVRNGTDLGLVTSEVDAAELAAATDESADPGLLGALATLHDSVIRAAGEAAGAVLPFRLGTVLTGPAAATHLLTTRGPELRHALDRVTGCDEWGVRVTGGPDTPAAMDTPAATVAAGDPAGPAGPIGSPPAPRTPAAEGSGIAYLRQRRAQLDRVQQRRDAVDALIDAVAARLRSVTVDCVPGRDGGSLLNRAYLVRREQLDAFIAAVDECGDLLAADGHDLRLTGPWPAYSFTTSATSGGTASGASGTASGASGTASGASGTASGASGAWSHGDG